MVDAGSAVCPLHGPGMDVSALVGWRVARVVASWHRIDGRPPSGPLDVWLINETGRTAHITTGTDWCLIVEESDPPPGYDMQDLGRVEVSTDTGSTLFAQFLDQRITAAQEQTDPHTGRIALSLTFTTGGIHCSCWDGELRLEQHLDAT